MSEQSRAIDACAWIFREQTVVGAGKTGENQASGVRARAAEGRGACAKDALPARQITGRSAALPATPCRQTRAREVRSGLAVSRGGRDAGPPVRRGSSKRLCGGRTACGWAVGRERVTQRRRWGRRLTAGYEESGRRRQIRGAASANTGITRTQRAEPTRVHDRSTSDAAREALS